MIVVIMQMKIGFFVTRYLVHSLNSVVMIIDAFHMVGFVMVIEIVQLEKMSPQIYVDLEIGHVLHQCLNVILVGV
jgi:hypothetical protein